CSKVNYCEQTESNAVSYTINDDNTQGSNTLEVSPREEVQTSPIIYNTEERISSEDLHNLFDGIRYLKSKGANLDSSYGVIELKGSGNRVVSEAKYYLDKSSSHERRIECTLRSRRENKGNQTGGKQCSVQQQNNNERLP
ncbi:unnamed protein product, partial [Ascophyllum nodosum]